MTELPHAKGHAHRVGQAIARLVGRPLFWVALVGLGLMWPMARAMMADVPGRLPVLGTLPAFELMDQHGVAVGAEDLRGRVWIASFIFTRCPSICPAITARMFDIQHHARGLGDSFRLVSFSVDPKYDTPAVLAAYAHEHRASGTTWIFLTGAADDVQRTVIEGFKVSMGRSDESGNPDSIIHGPHVVLVDQNLRIRGYYDSTDEDALRRVLRDAGQLANRGH